VVGIGNMENSRSAHGAAIESFYIPGEEGISEYWRRNKSTVVALELAYLLASLRKLTGYLGMNVGSIIWEGMKAPEETSAIILDPGIVRGKYPIPASKTDYAVGVAVREAYRRIEWGEKAESLAWENLGKADDVQHYRFLKFFSMAELIYLDTLANRSVLGLYAEVARRNDFAKARLGFIPSPSLEELLHYWWLAAADREDSRPLAEYYTANRGKEAVAEQAALYDDCLCLLGSAIRQKMAACITRAGVLERCQSRSDLYVELWYKLRDAVAPWPVDARTLAPLREDDECACDEHPRIPDATLRAIEAALAQNIDLTYEVRKACEEDQATVTVRTSDIIMPMEEKLDKQLFFHLKASLRQRSRRRNITSRGLKSGSIDPRRLYRAPMNGEVFMYRKPVFAMDHEVALLIDASSSMFGPKWKTSQRVFYALYEALMELNKRTRVFAYNEACDVCYLTELSCNDRLYTVVPRGKTASGEAIIAAAMMMLKKRSSLAKPLLVHITDGASNWGSDVSYAIAYCKRQKIGLITLGLGCGKAARTDLEKEFGAQVIFVDDIKSLPRKFSELVSYTTRLF